MKVRVNPWLLLLTASVVFAQTPDCGCEDKPQINVLAVVNGVKITKQDLSIETRTQVSLAQDTVIAARSRELAVQINKALLDAEAKRRGLTSTKLIELEVTAKVTEPTEAEARAFYERNKTRIGKNFKSAKKEIVAHLKSEREAARANEFANALTRGSAGFGSRSASYATNKRNRSGAHICHRQWRQHHFARHRAEPFAVDLPGAATSLRNSQTGSRPEDQRYAAGGRRRNDSAPLPRR